MTDIKELMARAMAEATRKWSGRDLLNQTELAQAANDALESAGYAIVPVEPTEKMIEEGEAELIAFDRRFDTFQDGAKDIFRAMLQAHKGEG